MTLDAIADALESAMSKFVGTLRGSLEDQGHVNTGRLSRSIQYKIEKGAGVVTATIEAEDYGVFVEFGVPASSIPYNPGRRGGGGTSRYIEGLIRYFRQKGEPEREAMRAAFATARVHAREGMPTNASARFSRTGERTGFAKTALENDLDTIARILENTTGYELTIQLADSVQMEPLVFYT